MKKNAGASTVDRYSPYFIKKGLNVYPFRYGYVFPLSARFKNNKIASRLAKIIEPDDVLFCYSNGATLAYICALNNVQYRHAIFINPALDEDIEFPANHSCKRIEVYYNRFDFWSSISAFLINHKWGCMGSNGYCGNDTRFFNNNTTLFAHSHSAMFKDSNVKKYHCSMVAKIRAVSRVQV